MARLSIASGVSVSTIKRIEDASYGSVADPTWLNVERALHAAGVTFLTEDENGPGVRVSRGACGTTARR